MASVDEVITELKRLRPEQVDEVARIIHELSQGGCPEAPLHLVLPAGVVEEAIQHGWPSELFTELIGSLPEIQRSAQPRVDDRTDL